MQLKIPPVCIHCDSKSPGGDGEDLPDLPTCVHLGTPFLQTFLSNIDLFI